MKINSTLIIIAGPSGVGKSTILAKILPKFDNIQKLRTITTRPKRTGEGGEQYHFVSTPEFENLIDTGELIEWTRINNYYYGARKKDLDNMLEQGIYPIAAIDIKGVKKYKEIFPDLLTIFISYESLEELPERLRATRPDASEAEITKRLETAKKEMEAIGEYEHIVINKKDRLEETLEKVAQIISKELNLPSA